MPTRQELILQFMLQLSSNSHIMQVRSADEVVRVAANLADEYIKTLA